MFYLTLFLICNFLLLFPPHLNTLSVLSAMDRLATKFSFPSSENVFISLSPWRTFLWSKELRMTLACENSHDISMVAAEKYIVIWTVLYVMGHFSLAAPRAFLFLVSKFEYEAFWYLAFLVHSAYWDFVLCLRQNWKAFIHFFQYFLIIPLFSSPSRILT